MADGKPTVAGMKPTVSEPTNMLGAALTSEVHLGYLTNDLDAAITHFESLGIAPWQTMEVPSETYTMRAGFAFMTGRMVELIQPMTDGAPIFPMFDHSGLTIEFHHLGTFMDVDSDALINEASAAGMETHRKTRERGDIVFVDTREKLGHWLEVLCFERSA